MLCLHNETVNIHSHLIASAAFAYFSYYFYHYVQPRYPASQPVDRAVFCLFLGGVAVCFLLSAM